MSTQTEGLTTRIVDDANQGRENARSVISPEDIMTAKRDRRYDIEAIPMQSDIVYHPELMINGAQILVNEDHATFEFIFNHDRSKVEKFLITLHDETKKLGDLFTCVPSGLIKKNITGIGATTLELKAWRNSIIVMPTKALAYTKAQTGLDHTTGKNKYQYVGTAIGDTPDITDQIILKYLDDPDIQYKKFIVVADSLPKLLEIIMPFILPWYDWKKKFKITRHQGLFYID